MPPKTMVLLPCAPFFSEGEIIFALLLAFLQCTLLLWPVAVRLARMRNAERGMSQALAELVELNRPQEDPYDKPVKRFRQLA